jgi:hypothetical protein
MAKIKITENELKQIIRESVNSVIGLNEDWQPWTPPQQGQGAGVRAPLAPNDQIDARNAKNSAALTAWNNLGTIGQIKAIQRLAGIPAAQCDGKIGPQTLAKVYIALSKGKAGEAINGDDLNQSSFRSGKPGTYTPISHNE